MTKQISLISIPFDFGASQLGCRMGPDALEVAGLGETLEHLGYAVEKKNISPQLPVARISHPNENLHHLAEVVEWTKTIATAAKDAAQSSTPIFLGGDHSISAGSISGIAEAAHEQGKPLFILWLDAHTDFHSPFTTDSGNLHGTPVAYFTGQDGFDAFPKLERAVDMEKICMLGLRSVDDAESSRIAQTKIRAHDMRAIDEYGMTKLLNDFLVEVQAQNGWLHVSLDVDFLDPEIAPAVGTTVPGGANFREAHLIMEILFETGLVRSMDIVELNPFLDERGKTAKLLVDLTASLFGKRIMDRKTRSY